MLVALCFAPMHAQGDSSKSWACRIDGVPSTLEMNLPQLHASFPWNLGTKLELSTCASTIGLQNRMGQGFIDTLDGGLLWPRNASYYHRPRKMDGAYHMYCSLVAERHREEQKPLIH
jgi:hypothetical protein